MSEELIDVSFMKRHEIVQAIRNAESLDKAVILMNGYAANGWLHLWDNAKHPDGSSVQKKWQSTQQSAIDRLTEQHNADDKRIADLLAVIAKKDEALQSVVNLQKYLEGPTVSQDHAQAKADAHEETMSSVQEALTLSADDVELVEVCSYIDPRDNATKPAYAIQMKGK